MVAGDLLRLAWEAEHDGRSRLRDALLTLAVAESTPDDAWAERCRTRLLEERPDHFLRRFATVAAALADPRVIEARDRLRINYPAARIEGLLLRARARRGPYLGRVESLDAMIEDLVGFAPAEADNVRLDSPQQSRGPLIRQRAARPVALSLAYPSIDRSDRAAAIEAEPEPETPSDWNGVETNPQEFTLFYATVLMAIAFLFASVEQARAAGSGTV